MMSCTEYRRALLAQPLDPTADMRLHVAGCPECTTFTERVVRFESRLAQALRVTMPEAAPRVAWAGRRTGFALAASLLAIVIFGSLWIAAPRSSLAAAVVGHMAEEPDAWAVTDIAVPQPQLNRVLSEAHVRLKAGAPLVSYANSCAFRGHVVPHLVVQTAGGPVTVMVLIHEPVKAAERFDEHGYRGVIVPVRSHGSLAVLEREGGSSAGGGMQPVDEVVARVLDAIEWTG